jgi:hypothetical protein
MKAWILAMTALAALTGAAAAQQIALQGVWQYKRSNARGEVYSGNVVVDTAGKARDVTHRPNDETAAQSGYIAFKGNFVEIVFTEAIPSGSKSYNPDHFRCTVQSPQLLNCANVDSAGSAGPPFPLTRTANAPRR